MKLKQQREAEISVTFTTAAQYICLAFALQQQKEIYRWVTLNFICHLQS